MASEVDICNLALAHLGDSASVASIKPAESSVQAAVCARFYPIARDKVLESHAWGFATRRVALAEIDNPVDSWEFAYTEPTDVLLPLSVLLPGTTDDTQVQPFLREALSDGSGVIYTNVEQASLRYIARVTDTTKFTPGFVVALSFLLGYYLIGPVLRAKATDGIRKAMLSQYAVELAQARTADSRGHKVDTYAKHMPAHLAVREYTRA